MRGRFIFILLVLVLAAGGMWLAARSRRARAVAETSLAAQARRRTELTARLERVETLRRSLPTVQDVAPAAASIRTPAKREKSESPALNFQELMATDPEFQVRHLAVQRALIALDYGAFFRARKLSPVDVDRFIELLVEKEAKRGDLASIQETRDLKLNDPALEAQRQQARAELRAAQVALLGEAGCTALQEYERVRPLWRFVADKAGLAVLDGNPLTADQAERLGQVIVGAAAIPAGRATAQLNDVDWKAAQMRAKAILSDDQIPLVFGRAMARNDAMSRFQAEFNRATNELMAARRKAAKAP